ncbi:R8 protein [Blastocladiella emersonii ATCC 22665]|nr:R8 protein [Blastocladiella emersonii ATCC 22665]
MSTFRQDLLTRNKNGLSTVWLAATLGPKAHYRRLSKKALASVNVPQACAIIEAPPEPLALRLTANLLVGVTRVYGHQYTMHYNDVNHLIQTLRFILASHRRDEEFINLQEATNRLESITLDAAQDINIFELSLLPPLPPSSFPTPPLLPGSPAVPEAERRRAAPSPAILPPLPGFVTTPTLGADTLLPEAALYPRLPSTGPRPTPPSATRPISPFAHFPPETDEERMLEAAYAAAMEGVPELDLGLGLPPFPEYEDQFGAPVDAGTAAAAATGALPPPLGYPPLQPEGTGFELPETPLAPVSPPRDVFAPPVPAAGAPATRPFEEVEEELEPGEEPRRARKRRRVAPLIDTVLQIPIESYQHPPTETAASRRAEAARIARGFAALAKRLLAEPLIEGLPSPLREMCAVHGVAAVAPPRPEQEFEFEIGESPVLAPAAELAAEVYPPPPPFEEYGYPELDVEAEAGAPRVPASVEIERVRAETEVFEPELVAGEFPPLEVSPAAPAERFPWHLDEYGLGPGTERRATPSVTGLTPRGREFVTPTGRISISPAVPPPISPLEPGAPGLMFEDLTPVPSVSSAVEAERYTAAADRESEQFFVYVETLMDAEGATSLSFDELVEPAGRTRAAAAQAFFHVLGRTRVRQEQPYGPIEVMLA